LSKKFKNEVVKGYNGTPIKIPVNEKETKELNLESALWIVLNNSPIKTMNDSIQGMRLAKALDEAKDKDIIEIEEGVHDWLKPLAEQVCPQLFRVNGSLVYDLIKEGFIKPEAK